MIDFFDVVGCDLRQYVPQTGKRIDLVPLAGRNEAAEDGRCATVFVAVAGFTDSEPDSRVPAAGIS